MTLSADKALSVENLVTVQNPDMIRPGLLWLGRPAQGDAPCADSSANPPPWS